MAWESGEPPRGVPADTKPATRLVATSVPVPSVEPEASLDATSFMSTVGVAHRRLAVDTHEMHSASQWTRPRCEVVSVPRESMMTSFRAHVVGHVPSLSAVPRPALQANHRVFHLLRCVPPEGAPTMVASRQPGVLCSPCRAAFLAGVFGSLGVEEPTPESGNPKSLPKSERHGSWGSQHVQTTVALSSRRPPWPLLQAREPRVRARSPGVSRMGLPGMGNM